MKNSKLPIWLALAGVLLCLAGCGVKPDFNGRSTASSANSDVPDEDVVAADLTTAKGIEQITIEREYYVAAEGSIGGLGTYQSPFSSIHLAVEAVLADGDALGTTIFLLNGVHRLQRSLVISEALSGTEAAPFKIKALEPGKAVLSGAVELPAGDFQQVSDSTCLKLLQSEVRGMVRVANLKDKTLVKALSDSDAQYIVNSRSQVLTKARWPNKGFAHIDEIMDGGVVYTSGRTPGERPKASLENPIGGVFNALEVWQGDWEAELALGMMHPKVYGFFYYDWHFENGTLAKITAERSLQLAGSTRYGIGGHEKIPRRFFVSGLLSELDQPGEWFFDPKSKQFYLWPIASNVGVEISQNWKLIHLKNASNVTIEGLVLEGAKDGMLIEGGSNVHVAGCTLRNLAGYGIFIKKGSEHRVESCDIYSVGVPIEARGTMPKDYTWDYSSIIPKIIPDGYIITNNHIFNCRNYRGVRLEGVGILFSHNLIHDLPGHAVYWGGNDNIFEFNEYYNLLKELGDGGVTYTGAQWHSYGNEQRYNFTHHVFSLPGAHPVNGFYIDDLDQGDRIYGNIFFKVGYRSIIFNGGSALEATNNIFISNYINVYQTGKWGSGYKEKQPLYDAGQLKRGDKTDFRWRTEQITGPNGWAESPWREAYPQFNEAMQQDPFAPWLTEINRNYEMFTLHKSAWIREVPDGAVHLEPMLEITLDAFIDPYVMNFAFKDTFETMPGFKPIPFDKIGLVADEYRPNPPVKDTYRKSVRLQNLERMPYDPNAQYDWRTINAQLYPN